MSEIIPEDILEAAAQACRDAGYASRNFNQSHSSACLAIAKAILADRQRDQWQPIETAPKDGSGFLAFINMDWIEGMFWNGEDWSYLSDADVTPFGRYKPTHWQPLPAAPKGE